MEVRAIAVRIADKLEQFNGQTYFLMDSSAVEYIDKNGNSQSVKDIFHFQIVMIVDYRNKNWRNNCTKSNSNRYYSCNIFHLKHCDDVVC